MTYIPLLVPSVIVILLLYKSLVRIKIDKLLIFMITIIFSLITGLRDETAGYDTVNYVTLFNNILNFQDIFYGYMAWKGDYFFSFIAYIVKIFTNDYHIFLFFVSFFSISILNIGLYRLYKQINVNNIFILSSLFFMTYIPYLLFGNTIRQGLSISLVVLALSYFSSKYKFYFILFLASFSHKSAMLFFIFPLFESFLKTYKYKYLYLLLLGVGSKVLLIETLKHLPFIGDKIIYYSNNFIEFDNVLQVVMLLLVIVLMLNKYITREEIRNNLIFNYLFFVLTISILLIDYSKISGRFILYLMPILPFILFYSMNFYKQRKVLKICIVTILLIFGFISVFLGAVQHNILYKF